MKKHIENVLREHTDFSHAVVLDFACGTGDLAYMFDPSTYTGVDVDARRIAYATKRFPAYSFETITANTLPLEDSSCDLIVVVAALHHIPDDDCRAYVKEFKRVLKPHGKCIGIEPCKHNKTPFSNWYMDVVDNGEYIRAERGYRSLFEPHFNFVPRKRFRKFFFYRELSYEALRTQA